MLIAILTDIHANREALAACLDHAARHHADRYAFVGDLIGYGADPAWVLDVVSSYCDEGAVTVLGNHDAAVLHGPERRMNPLARLVVEWTRSQLAERHLKFLESLPLQVEDGDRLFVHANAWAPGQWEYVRSPFDAKSSMDATGCRYTFCGHVHEPALYYMRKGGRVAAFSPVAEIAIPLGGQRRWLAIPGTVGQPRDGVLAARYALFDDFTSTLTYFRVPFDHETTVGKMRAAGLPQFFIAQLQERS
jgi:diadenosine tetraphosphatase ApaH/serine/threonine PP2A family protein phosphatase